MADEGLTFEAWTMPHVGTLAKKFIFSDFVESYTLNDRFNDLSDGVATIPDDAALPSGALLKDMLLKIDEADHANDVGSMVRVLRGATPIIHYLVTRSEDSWSDTEPTQKLTFEGLEWILDRCLVPNYDHPADPTQEPDWIYGADTVLVNATFEDTGATNLLIHLWIEATVTAGTWNIEFDDGTTVDDVTLDWNDDITAVQTGIEGLSNVADIAISGLGTASNPWVIEVIDPAGTDFNVTVDSTGLTGGAALMLSQHAGGAGITDPWTRSFNPLTGLYHGTYTNFQTSTVEAHTGIGSLYVKGGLGAWPDSWPGAQQVVSVTGGRTYRCGIWAFPKFTAPYRFVIRTTDETFIGSVEASLIADLWQPLTLPVTIPTYIRSIIYRLSCISNTPGDHEWYQDDALLAPGQDAATLGKMVDDVRTAAIAVGSPLAWLTPTWTTTLDSDLVAWDAVRKWNVNHGQSFLQLLEIAKKWNYESRIRWSVANSRFEWDMWNPTAGGQVRANIAITGLAGAEGAAPIVKRPPLATYVKAEGELGRWGEFASTTLNTVWGRLEKFHQDRQGVNSAELDVLAERIQTKMTENTAARSVTVADPAILPWTAYEPGDTVTLNLGPKDVRRALRVVAIVASKDAGVAVPRYDVHFGSPVYDNATALAAGLGTVLREFRRPMSTSSDGNPIAGVVTGGTITTFSLPGQAFVEAGRLRQYFAFRSAILGIQAAVHVAPTGQALIADVNKSGLSIFADQAQRPTIAAGANVSGVSVPSVTIIEPGEYLTVDIDQTGSTIAGGDVTVMVRWREIDVVAP